jgi:hypothetical protein
MTTAGTPPKTTRALDELNAAVDALTLTMERVLAVGDMEFSPLSVGELKPGFYHANGDKYNVGSDQGKVLAGLSTEYKTRWGITTAGSLINLPNWYASDGRGYLPRAGSVPGVAQGDAIRNIDGKFEMMFTAGLSGNTNYTYTGPFTRNPRNVYNGRTFQGANQSDLAIYYEIDFDPSIMVPTANENRPLNKALTPTVYLGV